MLSLNSINALGFGLLLLSPTLLQARTGLPLPRFVSLRSGEVNTRVGPGMRYPLEWVFTRPKMPVEIIAEYENWRQIRDFEGTTGWVHQSMLSGTRTVMTLEAADTPYIMRKKPARNERAIARIEAGVIATLLECNKTWCRIQAQGYKGWLPKEALWGVYKDETVK